MRILTVVLLATSVLVGAALVRGVGYALTHAVGFSFGAPEPTRSVSLIRQPWPM